LLIKPIVPFEPVSAETVPQGPEWVAQIKWDGVRLLAYYDGQEVRLFNRRRHERTGNYPELLDAGIYGRASSFVLDGEVIALGPDGKPSFHQVMRRDGLRRLDKVTLAAREVPITYMVFDIVYLNGEWLTKQPLSYRLEKLQEIVRPGPHIQPVTSYDDGDALYQATKQHGLEGIVVKKKDSPYLPGEKRDFWRKVKHYRDLIAVVGGFTLNNGIANALLLGLYDEDGRLLYIGHSGTGRLSQQDWRDVTASLKSLVRSTSPFGNKVEREKEAIWVEPCLTVKVKFAEWTPAGYLRQPSIQAFVQIPPEECVFSM